MIEGYKQKNLVTGWDFIYVEAGSFPTNHPVRVFLNKPCYFFQEIILSGCVINAFGLGK